MKEEKQNLYEGMYIILSTLSEEARGKALEKIQKEIEAHGGEVLKMHDFGKRRMTYEIAGQREGHYFILYFKVKPSAIEELWKEYHLNEDLIRFMTLQTEKVAETIEFKGLAEVQ